MISEASSSDFIDLFVSEKSHKKNKKQGMRFLEIEATTWSAGAVRDDICILNRNSPMVRDDITWISAFHQNQVIFWGFFTCSTKAPLLNCISPSFSGSSQLSGLKIPCLKVPSFFGPSLRWYRAKVSKCGKMDWFNRRKLTTCWLWFTFWAAKTCRKTF